jgi:uncharacterized protein (TIGR00730 family)
MTPTFSVCVYCGSRPGSQTAFTQAARAVGTWIGQHGGQLVYGGGKAGLMGIVAEATLEAKGRVVGIIPRSMVEQEWAFHGCTELHIVDTMHERKRMMAEQADAFLALPGGLGTLEELFEVWAWRQLGFHDKPVGLLNINGYYDNMLKFLDSAVEQAFMGEWQRDLIKTSSEPHTLLQRIVQDAGFAPAPQLNDI